MTSEASELAARLGAALDTVLKGLEVADRVTKKVAGVTINGYWVGTMVRIDVSGLAREA